MRTRLKIRIAKYLCLAIAGINASYALAADSANGKLVVDGKEAQLTHAYAYVEKTNEGKDGVVVILADNAVAPDAVKSDYARQKLKDAGSLRYVELLVVSGKQADYQVWHPRFGLMMQPGGDDAEHVLELTSGGDSKTISGHAYTKSSQKSADDVPYSYDVTFRAAVSETQ